MGPTQYDTFHPTRRVGLTRVHDRTVTYDYDRSVRNPVPSAGDRGIQIEVCMRRTWQRRDVPPMMISAREDLSTRLLFL